MRIGVFRRTAYGFSAHECFTRAAALAYYSVFSLPPILLIAIYIAGLIYGQRAAAGQISTQLGSFVGPQAASQIQTMISSAAQNKGSGLFASLLAFAGLIVASTTAFAELQHTLNRVWSVEQDDDSIESVVGKRILSFLMVIGVGIIIIVSMAFGTMVSTVGDRLPFHMTGTAVYLAELLLPWLVISFVVAVMFKVLPDARVESRDVAVGAMLTAALLVLAKFGMAMYLSRATVVNSYGAAGALAVLLLWLYVSAAVLLMGAEFAGAWALEHGRNVEPTAGAHRIEWRRAA
jgi:membrane protein